MKIRTLVTDDDAVSSVIAVVVLVAIVVVLATIVASFALGLGEEETNVQPVTNFEFEHNTTPGQPHALSIKATEGDSLEVTELYLRGTIDGTTYDLAWTSDGIFDEFDPSGSPAYTIAGTGNFDASSEQITSSQGIRLEANNSPLDEYDLKIVWESDDESAVLDAESGSV